MAIAETGAIATNVTAQLDQGSNHGCMTFLRSDSQRAAGWLAYLAELPSAVARQAAVVLDPAPRGHWDLFTWWSDADWLPAVVETACYKDACSFPHGQAPYCPILTECECEPASFLAKSRTCPLDGEFGLRFMSFEAIRGSHPSPLSTLPRPTFTTHLSSTLVPLPISPWR